MSLRVVDEDDLQRILVVAAAAGVAIVMMGKVRKFRWIRQ